jgi:hypothetical protein
MPTVLHARRVAAPSSLKAMIMSMDLVGSMWRQSLYFGLSTNNYRGVYTDPNLGPVLYYHYVDTTIGYADSQKLFGWNAIDFSSGWPSV